MLKMDQPSTVTWCDSSRGTSLYSQLSHEHQCKCLDLWVPVDHAVRFLQALDLLSERCDPDMISINITPPGQHPRDGIQSSCQMLMSCISTAHMLIHSHVSLPSCISWANEHQTVTLLQPLWHPMHACHLRMIGRQSPGSMLPCMLCNGPPLSNRQKIGIHD